jgi:hypothetical protein
MWLNLIVLSAASLIVGFIIGVVVGRPRRWDAFVCNSRHYEAEPSWSREAPERRPAPTG